MKRKANTAIRPAYRKDNYERTAKNLFASRWYSPTYYGLITFLGATAFNIANFGLSAGILYTSYSIGITAFFCIAIVKILIRMSSGFIKDYTTEYRSNTDTLPNRESKNTKANEESYLLSKLYYDLLSFETLLNITNLACCYCTVYYFGFSAVNIALGLTAALLLDNRGPLATYRARDMYHSFTMQEQIAYSEICRDVYNGLFVLPIVMTENIIRHALGALYALPPFTENKMCFSHHIYNLLDTIGFEGIFTNKENRKIYV